MCLASLKMLTMPPGNTRLHRHPPRRRLGIGLVFAALLLGAGGTFAEPASTPADQAARFKAINGHNFENWTGKCEISRDANGKRKDVQCFIYQNLVLKAGGQRVLHVAIGYLPQLDDPVALFTLPLGILLPPGVSLKVDDGVPIRFPVERCEMGGCRAAVRLGVEYMKELKDGTNAEVIFDDASRRPIRVPLYLKGLTAGLKALR